MFLIKDKKICLFLARISHTLEVKTFPSLEAFDGNSTYGAEFFPKQITFLKEK